MATTRAKFKCYSVEMMQSSTTNPKYAELAVKEGYDAARKKADEDGEPITVPFDQPTVKLRAVIGHGGAAEENRAFWNATPSGNIQMAISNPDAAELFELGKEYYVDFLPAD